MTLLDRLLGTGGIFSLEPPCIKTTLHETSTHLKAVIRTLWTCDCSLRTFMNCDLSGLGYAPSKINTQWQLRKERCVLVVDDVEDNRDLLRLMLQRKGIIVLEAKDGQEAIDVACLQHPDGILMDLTMPVVDGFEATRQLKGLESTKDIPIVAISAHCRESDSHAKALSAGCLYCIKKPFDWELLDEFLRAI